MAARRSGKDFHAEARIKELETQVRELKQRLDELRKAKNTTITKRELQVVEIGGPNLGRRASEGQSETSDLDKKLNEMKLSYDKKIKELSGKQSCDHETELQSWKTQVEVLEAENGALRIESEDLREQAFQLRDQLSEKEANWCHLEEELNRKLKLQWGEKYAEWMAETERKLEELQHANTLMRGLLKKQQPPGRDPSGQD